MVFSLAPLIFTPTLFGGHNPFFLAEIAGWRQILIIAFGSLYTWLLVAIFGPTNDADTLRRFVAAVRPSGPGWHGYRDSEDLPMWPALLRVLGGAVIVYGTLFGIGHMIVGSAALGLAWIALAGLALFLVVRGAGSQKRASSVSLPR